MFGQLDGKFDIAGSYDGVQDRIVLESIALEGKPVAGKAKAAFALMRKDGAFAAAAGEITAEGVELSFPDFLRQDLTLSKFSLKADYDKASRRLSFERATIDAQAIAAEVRGAVTFADGAAPALRAPRFGELASTYLQSPCSSTIPTLVRRFRGCTASASLARCSRKGCVDCSGRGSSPPLRPHR